MNINDLTANEQMIVRALAKHGILTSDVVKEEFHVRSRKKIDNILRNVRTLKENGILERISRGRYTMGVDTVKEEKIIQKLEKAIKFGRQVTIEGFKKNGDPVVRIGTPKEMKFNNSGEMRVIYQDVARKGYRSLNTKNIDKITLL